MHTLEGGEMSDPNTIMDKEIEPKKRRMKCRDCGALFSFVEDESLCPKRCIFKGHFMGKLHHRWKWFEEESNG